MKRQFLLVLFACVAAINVLAQPVTKGQKAAGGTSDDYFRSMYLTKDGGLIAGGYSLSDTGGDKTESSRGTADFWVLKLDNKGNIQWDKTIGGNEWDELHAVQQTNDGGYILGGFSSSNISGEKTENSRGYSDYWIVKLDNTGTIQWDKTIGGDDGDALYALQQTSDGGYILGGSSRSGISGEKTESNRGDLDYWIVKLDNNGNIQWDKTIGGSNWDEFASLQQTNDGGYILGGSSQSGISGEKTQVNKGGADFWVVKLDNKGNIQWDKTIGGNSDDVLAALQQTNDNGYIVGGWSRSGISGDKTEAIKGGDDYWVVKIDAFGNVQSDKTIGGDNTDYLTTIGQTQNGGYILGGYSVSNISGDKTEDDRGQGSWDYWIVRLDNKLAVQWDKTIGGNQEDECFSVKETSPNHYVTGGISNSRRNGDKTVSTRGGYDYWLVKLVYNKPGSFEITDAENKNNITTPGISNSYFSTYPNPAKDVVHVEVVGSAVISLTDQAGKVLVRKTINNSYVLNVANIRPGLYYLQNNTTGAVRKIIISR